MLEIAPEINSNTNQDGTNAAAGGILGRQPCAPRTIMGAMKVEF